MNSIGSNNVVTRETLSYRADQFSWEQTDQYEDDAGDWSETYRTPDRIKVEVDSVRELHGKATNNLFIRTPMFTVTTVEQYRAIVAAVQSYQPSVGDVFVTPAPNARAAQRGHNVSEVETKRDPEQYLYPPEERIQHAIEKNGNAGPYAAKWVGRTEDISVREFSEVLEHIAFVNDKVQIVSGLTEADVVVTNVS